MGERQGRIMSGFLEFVIQQGSGVREGQRVQSTRVVGLGQQLRKGRLLRAQALGALLSSGQCPVEAALGTPQEEPALGHGQGSQAPLWRAPPWRSTPRAQLTFLDPAVTRATHPEFPQPGSSSHPVYSVLLSDSVP